MKFTKPQKPQTFIFLSLAVLSILIGIISAYAATRKAISQSESVFSINSQAKQSLASQSAKTSALKESDIRDTSVGTVLVKSPKDKKKQGTHILKRDDAPWPLYLISSRVDLSQYENKRVKVFGVTYDGGSKDWYLLVNKVEQK